MDFFARGAYHRAKKILGGPKKKPAGTRLTFGMDGFRRVRKKKIKTEPAAPMAELLDSQPEVEREEQSPEWQREIAGGCFRVTSFSSSVQ